MVNADTYRLDFRRSCESHTAYLAISAAPPPGRSSSLLSTGEKLRYDSFTGTRKTEYLLARLLTKFLVRRFYTTTTWQEIEVKNGVFGQPILSAAGNGRNIQLSIAHKNGLAGSLVFGAEHPLGLDIESVSANPAALAKLTEPAEADELGKLGLSAIHAWSAKEALSKILRCGLTVNFMFFKTTAYRQQGQFYFGEYEHFPQYRFAGFVISKHIITVAFPKRSELTIAHIPNTGVHQILTNT